MTEQTEAADPYVPDAGDETNLGLLIFEDAPPGGTTKIIRRILASDWLAADRAAAEARGAERVLAAVEVLCSKWERSEDRGWVSSCGDELRDIIAAARAAATGGGS